VSRHTINDAEKGFISALFAEGAMSEETMSREAMSKEAVDLTPETAQALGIKSVSLSLLDELEAQASTVSPEPKPEPKPKQTGVYEPKPEEFLRDPEPEPDESVAKFEEADEIDEEEVDAPDLPKRSTHGKLFGSKRAHPLDLFDTLNMRYKESWAAWEPETLLWSLRRDFGPVGNLVMNKIQAMGVAGRTDVPWQDWDIFENSGLAWNDIIPIFGAFQPVTPMQIAFTVTILNSIRKDEFANEVNAYIAAILDDHGIVYAPPEWFAGAQSLLDRDNNTPGLLTDIKKAWKVAKKVNPEEIDWNTEDAVEVQVLKLAVIKRYLEERQAIRGTIPVGTLSSTTLGPIVS
jgi:hypothetical protein